MLFIKIKFLTILMMVFMGLFSRFVLGFSLTHHMSAPAFHRNTQSYHFPDSGNRTSLRFISICRSFQKRRRKFSRDKFLEEELTITLAEDDHSQFEFMGEIIERESKAFSLPFKVVQ